MKKFIKKIIIFIVLVVFIFSIPYSVVFLLPPVYRNSYTASIIDKYERLKSIDEPKIILVGGSNYAFGVDSEVIEEAFDMPVVNMGLHASFGLETILNYVKSEINEGDIIILALEYTIEVRGSSDLVCRSLESDIELLSMVPSNRYLELAKGYLKYTKEKIPILKDEGERHYEGVYSRDAFNEYGDIEYPRAKNELEKGFLGTPRIPIVVNERLYKIIEAVNSLNEAAAREGATVYYSFPSVNELSLDEKTDIESYMTVLNEELNMPIISKIEDYVLDSKYFYDTDYHLNDEGSKYRTEILIMDMINNIPELKNKDT